MNKVFIRSFFLPTVLLLAGTFVGAVTISSVSDSTVTLTAGKMDGVQVGMTAMVYGVTTVEGKAAEVPIAKVQVTAVEDRSCTASILRALTTATGLKVSVGQKVQFQQALVPLPSRPAAESSKTKPQRTASPSKDPYAGLSPLELSEKADAAYRDGRFDDAEKLYSAVLRSVPDDPFASQRLKELSARKRQAEAEAQRQAERAEKLKNADYYLTRGDDAYKAGDFPVAASYYIKVAEVDESYRDAGGKYWLSKAKAAKAKGDTAALCEAMGKLEAVTVPEPLVFDLVNLGPVDCGRSGAVAPDAGTSSGSASKPSPVAAASGNEVVSVHDRLYGKNVERSAGSLDDFENEIEAGKEVTFPIKLNSGVGIINMVNAVVTLSKTGFAFHSSCCWSDFWVSSDKILEVTLESGRASRLFVKVAVKAKGTDKEHKEKFYFYHNDARAEGPSIGCPGCDDSVDVLYRLLTRIRGGH